MICFGFEWIKIEGGDRLLIKISFPFPVGVGEREREAIMFILFGGCARCGLCMYVCMYVIYVYVL